MSQNRSSRRQIVWCLAVACAGVVATAVFVLKDKVLERHYVRCLASEDPATRNRALLWLGEHRSIPGISEIVLQVRVRPDYLVPSTYVAAERAISLYGEDALPAICTDIASHPDSPFLLYLDWVSHLGGKAGELIEPSLQRVARLRGEPLVAEVLEQIAPPGVRVAQSDGFTFCQYGWSVVYGSKNDVSFPPRNFQAAVNTGAVMGQIAHGSDQVLRDACRHANWLVRVSAVLALGPIACEKDSVDRIIELLKDQEGPVAHAAACSIGLVGKSHISQSQLDAVREYYDMCSKQHVRLQVGTSLARLGMFVKGQR